MAVDHCLDCCAQTVIEARRRTLFRFASVCSYFEDPDEELAEGEIPTRYKVFIRTVTTTVTGNVTGDVYMVYEDIYTSRWLPKNYVTSSPGSECGELDYSEELDPRDELEPISPDSLLIYSDVEENAYEESFGTKGDIKAKGVAADPDVELDTGWKTALIVTRTAQDAALDEDDLIHWERCCANLMAFSSGDEFGWSGRQSLLEIRIQPGLARIAGDLVYDRRWVDLSDLSEATFPGAPLRLSAATGWTVLLEPDPVDGFQAYFENIRFVPLH